MIELKSGTKFEDLELETKYTFELDGLISTTGIKRVRRALHLYTEVAQKNTRWRLEINRSIGGPVWKTERGTFPKRVSNYMYKTYDIKLQSSIMRNIGNIAQQNSTEGKVIFDFTRRILWNAGEFGDDGSCFWTDYGGSRIAMMRVGIGAVRIYDSSGEFGRGRAWFFPVFSDAKQFVLFNAYGIMQARLIANFLSQLFGEYKYRQIHIGHTYLDTIHHSAGTYELYQNSDGYIIHNKPSTARINFPVLDGRRPEHGTRRWAQTNLPSKGNKWFDKE